MIPPYDDEALMEAVFSRGPLAVTVDAAQPGFRFYSGGVPAGLAALSCLPAAGCMMPSSLHLQHG